MQENSLFKKNILQFIDNKGIKKSDFYRKTGITRSVLDKNSGLSEDNLTKFIATYPEVNIEWLLTGEGPMLRDVININQKANGFYNNNMLGDHNTVNEPMEKYGTNDNDCSEIIKEKDRIIKEKDEVIRRLLDQQEKLINKL